jgi:hypothetical protein
LVTEQVAGSTTVLNNTAVEQVVVIQLGAIPAVDTQGGWNFGAKLFAEV